MASKDENLLRGRSNLDEAGKWLAGSYLFLRFVTVSSTAHTDFFRSIWVVFYAILFTFNDLTWNFFNLKFYFHFSYGIMNDWNFFLYLFLKTQQNLNIAFISGHYYSNNVRSVTALIVDLSHFNTTICFRISSDNRWWLILLLLFPNGLIAWHSSCQDHEIFRFMHISFPFSSVLVYFLK